MSSPDIMALSKGLWSKGPIELSVVLLEWLVLSLKPQAIQLVDRSQQVRKILSVYPMVDQGRGHILVELRIHLSES